MVVVVLGRRSSCGSISFSSSGGCSSSSNSSS